MNITISFFVYLMSVRKPTNKSVFPAGWCSDLMNLWYKFIIFARACWNIRPLYLSSIGKLLFIVAHTLVGRTQHWPWPPPLILLSIVLQKIEACSWKLMYKAFFILKWTLRKSTMICAAPKIALLLIWISCKQVHNVMLSPVYLGHPGSW